jgi:hypothetical protein
MQVSIVGQLKQALPFVKEVLAAEGDVTCNGFVRGPLQDVIRREQLHLPAVESAETACVGDDHSLVAVAESSADESIRLARIAIQSGRHVFMFQPEDVSPAWGFELQLLLDESTTVIIPVCGRFRREALQNSGAGAIVPEADYRQIHLDLAVPSPTENHLEWTQRQALDIVASVGILYTNVIAVEQRATDKSLIQRTITLGASVESGKPAPPAVIMLRPRSPMTHDRLALTDTTGTVYDEAVVASTEFMPVVRTMIRQPALAGRLMADCAATLELDHAARRSLKRRRAIDVHHDSGSERSVFKSQMTAMGCVVLVLMMFGLVGYLVLAHVLQPPEVVLRIARAVWIAPAVLYLLAQLLLPIARNRSAR